VRAKPLPKPPARRFKSPHSSTSGFLLLTSKDPTSELSPRFAGVARCFTGAGAGVLQLRYETDGTYGTYETRGMASVLEQWWVSGRC